MRLPRVRLPRPRLSFSWLGNFGGRLTLLYIAYTAVLFVGFLLWTFPYKDLVDRVLSNLNNAAVKIDVNAASFAWHRGVELSGIRVAAESLDGRPPLLECSRLWVRPSLNALVRGNPYALLMYADLYGGAAQGEVNMSDGSFVGAAQWQDLNLGRYRTLTSLFDEGQLAGRVSGQLSFEARAGNANAGQVIGEINLEGTSLTGAKIQGFSVPDIHFRQTKVRFTLHGDRLEVQEFNATGDLVVQASGHIVLRDPLPESVLNLRAMFETSLATPDAIKGAVALIPRAPGAKADTPVTITGTLAKPKMR